MLALRGLKCAAECAQRVVLAPGWLKWGLKCAAGCAQRVVLAPGYRGREPRVVVATRPHGTWIGNPAYM
jgi:hypothetical protein